MCNNACDNGKTALRSVVDGIRASNDTTGWHEAGFKWQEALEEEFAVMHDSDEGDGELCDILAYVLDCYGKDRFMTAAIACYGLAFVVAEAIEAAEYLGEGCRLLD